MFKLGSFEGELAKGMETKLIARQTENQFSLDRIAKAVDFLNAASQIFDDTGFYAEAEVLTSMLERIANNKLVPQTVKTAEESLTPEEFDFYKSLPVDTKMDFLQQSEQPGDWFPKLKELHKVHKSKKQNPEVLEFESLAPSSRPKVPTSPFEVLEFESLAPQLEKEHELAPLRVIERKKKV
jgi:hypothetical protein